MNDMDAQNAAVSDLPKHSGASPQEQQPPPPQQLPQKEQGQQQKSRQGSGSDADRKSPLTNLRASSPAKDAKPKVTPPALSATTARSDDAPTASADRDSDAETIVLPGKDGHSPSKVRKVRQEDKSESDGDAVRGNGHTGNSVNNADRNQTVSRPGEAAKKKRLLSSLDKDRQHRNKDGASSGLSSAPASPPNNQSQHQHQHHRRRRSDAAAVSPSDSEGSHHKPSSKASLREKLKSGERLLPHKRKALRADSDDEAESRKARRQRTTSVTLESGRVSRDHKMTLPAKPSHHDSHTRSISPQPRQHRRTASNQLLNQNSLGVAQKKKRLPPPLQPTDYQSDESSTSGSPHPRSSKLRSLTTPATAESNASPVKMPPHKKHLDAHGQTLLARACARGEYESVKQRLGDRPEDLNVADYAGNTPLQIAAINGCEDIVKLLIEAGCNLDCVNYDKDTPLLDAVDNGHAGVVRLLVEAGVNPRKANVNGEEPIDRVTEDTENAGEIRELLSAAKKRAGERRRTSEDRHSHLDYHDARESHAPDSPRQSPAAMTSSSTNRRSANVRSTKTRNDLLYMPLDDKTLRQAAGRGDEETVARILQVKEGYDDPESMVAAARGGHDLVIQLLLGLGGANADPPPVVTLPSEFATPILAAIGQENIKVVELLLEQQGFDPTRRFKGETYYEIARRRQGTNWKEEEHMLKNAYDEYKRSHKDTGKAQGRREREREREEKRAKREEAKDEARPPKRTLSSPSQDGEPRKKSGSSKLASPQEKRRSDSFTSHGEENNHKRGPGRPKKDERLPSINVSDRELSPTLSHKPLKAKRAESDLTAISSEGEAVKPRRKLISKGELRGEREKQKRGSMTSNPPSMKDPSSPHESRNDESVEKPKLSERYHDRTKALKRDGSKDRLSVSGDGVAKRHRTSLTPDRPSDCDKDSSEAPIKRRRLDGDDQEKRLSKRPTSADGKPRKSISSRDSSGKTSTVSARKGRDEEVKGVHEERERDLHRKDSGRTLPHDKVTRIKSEDVDTAMPDADPSKDAQDTNDRKAREKEEEDVKKKKELIEREDAKKEDERRRARVEEKKKREQEELRQREEDERKKRKEQEEREAQKKREAEEEARKLREQAERERREAEDVARRQEEEKRRVEEEKRKKEEEQRKKEEEQKKKEEEQRKKEEEQRKKEEEQRKREEEEKRQKEEERRQKEEDERKKREEEERLQREQLEREAAEEAQRQREEEERKERERLEQAHREEMERKRAAEEAAQKRLREEQERVRLEKLPPLLRWLNVSPNPKVSDIVEKFRYMQGVRYDTIRPEANYTPEGREQWVLNTHVALLLGDKDLELSKYPSWERVPVSNLAKLTIWRTEWTRYALVAEKLWDLGRQLPGYYGDEGPSALSFQSKEHLKRVAWDKFLNMDMFFVKVSDLMSIIPNLPHLRDVKLGVEYRELMESESETVGWKTKQKWKQDPDASRFHGFAPRHKYYVNGTMVGEEMPTRHETSKTPFPETRVPRRGLVQVFPDDPDYTRMCLEQGLQHLIKGYEKPEQLSNGVHSPPTSQTSATSAQFLVNGTNGHSNLEEAKVDSIATNGDLPNGVDGSST